MVNASHSDWVGCHSSVRPFQTGTGEKSASVSTVSCLAPRNSMPSYIRASTRAVSAADSFDPMCEPEGSR